MINKSCILSPLWDFPASPSRSTSPWYNASEFPTVSGWKTCGRRGFGNTWNEQVVEPPRYHLCSEIIWIFMRTALSWKHLSRNSLVSSILVPEVSFMCVLCSLLRWNVKVEVSNAFVNSAQPLTLSVLTSCRYPWYHQNKAILPGLEVLWQKQKQRKTSKVAGFQATMFI